MLIVRYSAHIEDDLRRNWSSWNFGTEGFEGTRDELQVAIDEAIADGEAGTLYISGFDIPSCDLTGNEIENGKFRELYSGCWVVPDLTHGTGLACHILGSETLEEAISEIRQNPYKYGTGEGDFVDCNNAKLLYSQEKRNSFGFHILEVEE